MASAVFATSGVGETSSPTGTDYFTTSIQSCVQGIEAQLVGHKTLLNGRQCLDLCTKLVKTVDNVQKLVSHSQVASGRDEALRPALENLHRILEKARFLINGCSEADYKALIFQIQNEEAFREILYELGLCYNAIYEQAKHMVQSEGRILGVEDLRESSSTFVPALESEVLEDQHTLQTKLENLVRSPSNDTKIQCLAKYLLDNLKCICEYSGGNRLARLMRSNVVMWVTETETQSSWKTKGFVGNGAGARGVLLTEWLGIPCAKKIFKAHNSECADLQGTLGCLATANTPNLFGIQSIKKELHNQLEDFTFRKEVALLARLNHPNVVKFFCCGRHSKDECFIGMELMEMDLSSLIRNREGKPFAIEVALDMILQIARGMLYLHDRGIAHRDLKPLNVVISKVPNSTHLVENFCVKLIDFGLSKAKVQASMSSTVSIPNCGTVTYRAPEVFSKAHEQVPRGGQQKVNWFKADVYSFALTCSVILSLKKPFEGRYLEAGEEDERYLELINGTRPEIPSSCPKELDALLKECWETNPERRPHFSTICTRLEKYKHGLLRSLSTSMDDGLEEVKYDETSDCNACIERILEECSRHRSSIKDLATNSSAVEAEVIVKAIMMVPYYVGRGILLNGLQLSLNLPTWCGRLYKSVGASARLDSLEAEYSSLELDYLLLSVQYVEDIAQVQRVGHETLLNGKQCQHLSSVFVKCVEDIEKLVTDFGASRAESFRPGLWNLYIVSEKLRRLVNQCCEADWCRAAVFQIRNEVAFQDILMDMEFCYNVIFDKAESMSDQEGETSEVEVLRRSSTFSLASEGEIFEDRCILKKRLENVVESVGSSDEHEQCLARYLLGRLGFIYEEHHLETPASIKAVDDLVNSTASSNNWDQLDLCVSALPYIEHQSKLWNKISDLLKGIGYLEVGTPHFSSSLLQGLQEELVMCLSEGTFWVTREEPPGTWTHDGRIFSQGASGITMSTKWLGIPCAKEFMGREFMEFPFWRCQKVMARLHHPNVIKFFCWGKEEREGQYFIGMELMETDLSACIERQEGRPFPIAVALDIIVQIARGMRYLHSQGIAHRDLKPANVLISRALTSTEFGDIFYVKLTGFEICKANVESSRAEAPTDNGMFGTVGYMAPEVATRSVLPLKPFKADIFSFAMTSSDVLSFKRPPGLQHPVPFAAYEEAINAGVRPEIASRCPKELVALLKECWDTDPELRPDFDAVCTRLQKIVMCH